MRRSSREGKKVELYTYEKQETTSRRRKGLLYEYNEIDFCIVTTYGIYHENLVASVSDSESDVEDRQEDSDSEDDSIPDPISKPLKKLSVDPRGKKKDIGSIEKIGSLFEEVNGSKKPDIVIDNWITLYKVFSLIILIFADSLNFLINIFQWCYFYLTE